jgi:hypothetical protein
LDEETEDLQLDSDAPAGDEIRGDDQDVEEFAEAEAEAPPAEEEPAPKPRKRTTKKSA